MVEYMAVKFDLHIHSCLSPCANLEMSPTAIVEQAVKAGMDPFQALQAITINPARHIGAGDRVGSLEAGKDADP